MSKEEEYYIVNREPFVGPPTVKFLLWYHKSDNKPYISWYPVKNVDECFSLKGRGLTLQEAQEHCQKDEMIIDEVEFKRLRIKVALTE